MPLLSVNNLEVCYGVISALQDVSLHIDRGEIVTLIGANGAGKTTLLRAVSGLIRPTQGKIEFFPDSAAFAPATTGTEARTAGAAGSRELHRLAPHEIVRLGVSHVPEGRQVFPQHTVRENLLLGAYQDFDKARVRAGIDHCYSLFPVLAERR